LRLFSCHGVRKRLLSGIEANPEDASDEDVIEGCTKVQADLFEYLHVLSEENLEQQNKRYYEYRFTFEGQSLLFRCYNTAWMSQLHEQQGHLVFPLDKAADKQNGFDLVVSVLHPPFNRMQSENARALKSRSSPPCNPANRNRWRRSRAEDRFGEVGLIFATTPLRSGVGTGRRSCRR
jgi:hypothetical protein